MKTQIHLIKICFKRFYDFYIKENHTSSKIHFLGIAQEISVCMPFYKYI